MFYLDRVKAKRRHAISALYLSVFAGILAGCGGGSEDSGSPDIKPPSAVTDTLHASNGLATTKVDTSLVVDLKPYVQGEKVELSNVIAKTVSRMSAEGHCGVDDFNPEALQATLVMKKAGRCDYQYTITNNDGQRASATLTLVTSSLPDPILPTVSISAAYDGMLEEVVAQVDLSNLLGSGVIPAGFELDNSLFTTQPSFGSVDIDPTTIVKTGPTTFAFNVPETIGWNKISYALKKSGATPAEDEVLVGSVFVSLTFSTSNPPTITPSEAMFPDIVKIGELVEVDLDGLFLTELDMAIAGSAQKTVFVTDDADSACMNACGNERDFYCSGANLNKAQTQCALYRSGTPTSSTTHDHFSRVVTIKGEGKAWQIAALESFGAHVEASDADDVYNKKFKFQANKAGVYDVAYIVVNHGGESALGVLKFRVESDDIETKAVWEEIPHDNKIYSAPLTRQQAEPFGVNDYAQETIYGDNFQVARFTVNQADNYCATLGARLPTTAELESLTNASGNAATLLDLWPKVQSLYWAQDGETAVIHSLITNSTVPPIQNYPAYTTCVLEPYAFHGVFEYKDDNIDTTADALYAGGTTTLTVTVSDRVTGTPEAGIAVTASASSDSSISCPNPTDANGQVECTVSSTLAGTAAYTLDYTIGSNHYYSRHVTPVVPGSVADIKRFDYALVGTKSINVFRAVDQYGNLAEAKNLPVSITFTGGTGKWWMNNEPVVLGHTYEYQATNEWGLRTDSVDDLRFATVVLEFNSAVQTTSIIGVKNVQSGVVYDFAQIRDHLVDASTFHSVASNGELFKLVPTVFTESNFVEVRADLDQINNSNVAIINALTGTNMIASSVSGTTQPNGTIDFNGLTYDAWFQTPMHTIAHPNIDYSVPLRSTVQHDSIMFRPVYDGRASIDRLSDVIDFSALTPQGFREHFKKLFAPHGYNGTSFGSHFSFDWLYNRTDETYGQFWFYHGYLEKLLMLENGEVKLQPEVWMIGANETVEEAELADMLLEVYDRPFQEGLHSTIKPSNCHLPDEELYFVTGIGESVDTTEYRSQYFDIATGNNPIGHVKQYGQVLHFPIWSQDLENPREGICEFTQDIAIQTLMPHPWDPTLPNTEPPITGTHDIGLEAMVVGIR